MRKQEKTVIILGAGFSAGCGISVQNSLLPSLAKWASNEGGDALVKWQQFQDFIDDAIGPNMPRYLIEDIFTIFDKCLSENVAFRGYSIGEISSIKQALLAIVSAYTTSEVNRAFNDNCSARKVYRDFIKAIITKRDEYCGDDKFSIVSLNWDNYLEKTMSYILQSSRKNHPDVKIDYCVYNEGMSRTQSTPSLLIKSLGGKNLKILKPHGSINWGECPDCGRLYIANDQSVVNNYTCKKYCDKKRKSPVDLKSMLITPTYMKNIQGTHFESVWHNAAIEITEATKLIFIGYSLRPEDYLFRFALSKSYNENASIYVYDLYSGKRKSRKKAFERRIQKKFEFFFQKAHLEKVCVDGWESSMSEILSLLPK